MIVQQIAYYGDANRYSLNRPKGLVGADLMNGINFIHQYDEIMVKGTPGTKIHFETPEQQDKEGVKIIIGDTEVYNIFKQENVTIKRISVDKQSLIYIDENDNAYLTITVVKN